MKRASQVRVADDEEAFVRDFDLRQIDAEPANFWTRMWWARTDRILALARRHAPAGGRILDVGCAQGNAAILLSEDGYRCVGLDLRPNFLRYAQKKEEAPRVAWVVANGHELPFEPEAFDVVILAEILEHVAEPDDLMVKALRWVKPGGSVICTTPNGRGLRNRALPPYFEAAKDIDDLKARQFGPAGEDHLFAIRPSELRRLVPPDADLHLEVAVSELWSRPTSFLARWRWTARAVETVSRFPLWRESLCDSLIIVLTRRDG